MAADSGPQFCGCLDDLTSGAMAGGTASLLPSDLLGTAGPVFLAGCSGAGIPCIAVLQQMQPNPNIEFADDGSIISANRPYNYIVEDINGEPVDFAQSTEWIQALSAGSTTYFQGPTAKTNPFSDIVGFGPDSPPVDAFVSAQAISVQIGGEGPNYLLNTTILHGAAMGGGMFASFSNPAYWTQYGTTP